MRQPQKTILWLSLPFALVAAATAQRMPKGEYQSHRERSFDFLPYRAELAFDFESTPPPFPGWKNSRQRKSTPTSRCWRRPRSKRSGASSPKPKRNSLDFGLHSFVRVCGCQPTGDRCMITEGHPTSAPARCRSGSPGVQSTPSIFQ
jgi:hypothetical protein